MRIHDYDSAVAFLMGRINYEQAAQIPYHSREFKLRRMERLLERLDNPHHKLPAVHIAGTKGKGSTAVMIESMARAAGCRTGLYTSPHLERMEERFVLDGAACDERRLVHATQAVSRAAIALDESASIDGATGPTYFEITTAIAMLLFAEAEVDVAVLEVGLGGRLDSTNVCRPLVSVITSISHDHTKQLGNTIASIAREKAGIIKPGAAVISGAGNEEAAQVVRETASRSGCSLRELEVDFGIHRASALDGRGPTARAAPNHALTYWESHDAAQDTINNLSLAMLGRHQTTNAAIAIAAVRELKDGHIEVSNDAIRTGLTRAVCPARVELISPHPPIILDAAHNVASCRALVEAIEERFSHRRDRTLILATSSDKDAGGMIKTLLPHFQRIIFTRYLSNPRAADPLDLQACAAALIEEHSPELLTAESPAAALAEFRRRASSDALLCIAGSFFLAGEMRPQLPRDGGGNAGVASG